jgi:hypothetical protein
MKKKSIIILIALFICSLSQAQNQNKKLEELAMDLSSINVQVRGDVSLFGKYKGDLSNFTYEAYLDVLKKMEKSSNKGISSTIQQAEKHYFSSKKNSFIIAIYSKKLKAIIVDDANTAFPDSVKVLRENEKIPDLKSFCVKWGYK